MDSSESTLPGASPLTEALWVWSDVAEMKVPPSVEAFLAGKRLAVVGVSRDPSQPANAIYRRLRELGYDVFPVNPSAGELEGDRAYADIASLPDEVDGAVVLVPPEAAEGVVRACAEKGIPRIWLHRSFGAGSVSEAAVARGKELGVEVLAGGCPMMFAEPVDAAHKCMRFLFRWPRRLARP